MRTEAATRTGSKIIILKGSTQFLGKMLQFLLWAGSVILEHFKGSYLERYIQDAVKHIWGSFFIKTVDDFSVILQNTTQQTTTCSK